MLLRKKNTRISVTHVARSALDTTTGYEDEEKIKKIRATCYPRTQTNAVQLGTKYYGFAHNRVRDIFGIAVRTCALD